jgi:hypothetical protein
MSEERFIDADTHFEKDQFSYDDLIVKQINVCRDILSKDDSLGGGVKVNANNQAVYTGDVKKETINAVDTFKRMMSPFIKGDHLTWVNEIEEDILKRSQELGERVIVMRGLGEVKVKDARIIDHEHPINKELIVYKYELSRDLFEVLVVAYHANKALIKSFEEE